MLTDEEIKQVIYSDPKRISGWVTIITPRDRAIAEAQEQATRGEIAESFNMALIHSNPETRLRNFEIALKQLQIKAGKWSEEVKQGEVKMDNKERIAGLPYEWDVIKISRCKKHSLYWITDCPECVHEQYDGYIRQPEPSADKVEAVAKMDIEQVKKILEKNITLHSIREGNYGVFNITSFGLIAKEICELDSTLEVKNEEERILVYLKSLAKNHPKVSLAEAIKLIEASRPASYTSNPTSYESKEFFQSHKLKVPLERIE